MLNHKKSQQIPGFTWVELLVVIAIIGILVAFFLPKFIARQNCTYHRDIAPQLAQFQQEFFQKKGYFAQSVDELDARLVCDTDYTYSIETNKTKTFVFGQSGKPELRSYVVGVFVNPTERNASTAIVCKAKEVGTHPIAPPIDMNTCGAGTIKKS
jgi:prepilin-type N-terminal cleavage/methylation domain-containing protein